uniref:G-protein coupled receptors family 1 profile domain-containing protein n=1 Tax=Clytia hemisphaerica TaxID=252671 RepID=A0A7M5XIY9_9CNID
RKMINSTPSLNRFSNVSWTQIGHLNNTGNNISHRNNGSTIYNTTGIDFGLIASRFFSTPTYISQELKCCVTELFDGVDINILKSMDAMKEYMAPCSHHHNDTNVYVSDVFKFYLKSNHTKEMMECKSFHCGPQVQVTSTFAVYITILVLTFLIGVLGNSLVCAVIIKSNTLRKRATNYFLLSLAIGDLLSGLVIIPIKIFTYSKNGKFCMGQEMCRMYRNIDPFIFTTSITHLLVICIDRFIAIDKPFYYPRLFSFKNIKIMLSSIWVYALSWGFMNNVNWSTLQLQGTFQIKGYRCLRTRDQFSAYLYMIVFVVPCLIMALLYGRMWHIAMAHAKEIRKRYNNYSSQASLDKVAAHSTKKFIAARLLELKATKVICVVFGTFVVCWVPLIILVVIDTFITKVTLEGVPYKIVVEYLPLLNSSLNPFIYCFFHKDFQKGLKHILQRMAYTTALKLSLNKKRNGNELNSTCVGTS